MITFPRSSALGLLLGVAMCLVVGGDALAQVYKSVDAEGNVTYSETPPPGSVQTEEVDTGSQPTADEVQQSQQQEAETEQSATQLGQPAPQSGTNESSSQPESPVTVEPQPVVVDPYPERRVYGDPNPAEREDIRRDTREVERSPAIRR